MTRLPRKPSAQARNDGPFQAALAATDLPAHPGAKPLFENSERRDDLGLMSIEDLAIALGKAPGTIRNWVARREIPFTRLGNRTVFNRESVRRWLLQMETKPNGSH